MTSAKEVLQLLEVPAQHRPMVASISLTGITYLNERNFKARLQGAKEFIQVPAKGIVHKSKIKEDTPKIIKRKKAASQVAYTDPCLEKKVKEPKKFVVNKKEVTHRIRNYINQQSGKKRLYFWTVTFPLHTPDDTAYILLNKWLTRLRKEKLLHEYLWVAERQENKTIHFHIAIPHYLDVKKANKYMRASIMYSIGAGEIKYTHEQAKNYNGVDIAKDRKTKRIINFGSGTKNKSLTNYLTKYVTKNQTPFERLAWHCSRAFSNLVIAFRLVDSELIYSQFSSMINLSKTFKNDWVTFIPWAKKPPDKCCKYLAFVNQNIQEQLSQLNQN